MADVLLGLLQLIFYLFCLLLLARALLSLAQVDPYHPAIQLLYILTEPILRPLRRAIPQVGAFDFSPLVAIILAQLIYIVLQRIVGALFQ